MAVQAQHPLDFHSNRALGNGMEDHQIGNLVGAYNNLAGHQILNGAVFIDPENELTCNASRSKKRIREEDTMILPRSNHEQYKQEQISQQFQFAIPPKVPKTTASASSIANNLQLSYEQNRLQGSAGTSTSGRSILSPQDLASHLHHQNLQIDALIRLNSGKLRSGLEEVQKRHCREILSIVGQQVAKKLTEKEAELENARRRQAELEAKVKQITAENLMWFNVAKNSEAVASTLKTSLDQVLRQNAEAREGFGGCHVAPFPADDAQSCCFEEEHERKISGGSAAAENENLRWRKSCKVCREKDASVLLLQCRHLCLCKECESVVDTCPICNASKNVSFQVFMS